MVVVNRNAEECQRLSKLSKALIVHGDGTIPRVLEESGTLVATGNALANDSDVDNATVLTVAAPGTDLVSALLLAQGGLLALTPRDEDNYVICSIAKLRYGVAAVFALVHDPDNEEVFQELGLEGTFSITVTISSLIEQRSASRTIRSLQPLADGKVGVTEVVIPGTAPSVGRALKDIRFPASTLVAAILRDGEVIVPNGETVLAAGDALSFVSLPERYAQSLDALVGRE